MMHEAFAAGLFCAFLVTMLLFGADAVARRNPANTHASRLAPLAACDPEKPEIFACLPKWPPS